MRNTTRAGALGAAALTALLFAIPSAGASDNAVACPGQPAENVQAVQAVAGARCGEWHAPAPAGCCDPEVEVPETPGNECDQCVPDTTEPTTPEPTTPEPTTPEVDEPAPTPVAVPVATPAPRVVAVPTYTG